MSKEEMTTKLIGFLSKSHVLTEECQVVYLMVEIRKIIDQTRSATRYPFLKFYSDWTVHSKKDVITPEVRQMSEEMFSFAVSEINAAHPGMPGEKSQVLEFAYMSALGKEMNSFFMEFGFESDLPTDETKWINFVSLLVKVLENQPINNPSENVQSIIFEPANARCVILTIFFKNPVNNNHFYRLMNAF